MLSVAAFSGAAGNLNIGAVARELLELSLFELTGAIELIHLPGAPLRTVAGASIARIPNVACWFTDTWSVLRFQREKAWRRASARADVFNNPAEIMAIWALGAIEWFATSTELSGGNPQTAAQIWLAVEAAFREARLVEPRAPHDFWSQAVARLFLWWPHAVSSTPKALGDVEDVASANVHLLGDALSPYVEISADFTAIVVSLHHAGVGATELDDAVAATGGDLLHIIARFVETWRVPSSRLLASGR